MHKIAFLFPGQGSQSVGMGREVYEKHPRTTPFVDRAGEDLKKLMFEGPEDELRKTQNTQPALYVASAATLEVLRDAGIEPYAVAGHSLGEYTALYAAGVFDYDAGLDLVKTRGMAFADAGQRREGTMSAVIGMDGDKVEEVCQAVSAGEAGVVVPANFNEPSQTVISGDPSAVSLAGQKCSEAGARKVVPLPVSGAFHSPLVETAATVMYDALAQKTLKAPQCRFVANYTASELRTPNEIVSALVSQVTGPVRWVGCIRALAEMGCETFVEVGSGKVLAGLCRRIDRGLRVLTTESAEQTEKTIEELKKLMEENQGNAPETGSDEAIPGTE